MSTTTEAMVCRHCDRGIRFYDLAYFHATDGGPWYVHDDGWFGCMVPGLIGKRAEPEIDPYLFGEAGHRLDLAATRLRLAIWYPLSRFLGRILDRLSPDVHPGKDA